MSRAHARRQGPQRRFGDVGLAPGPTTRIDYTVTPNPTSGAFLAVGVPKNQYGAITGNPVYHEVADTSKATVDNVSGVGAKVAAGSVVVTGRLTPAPPVGDGPIAFNSAIHDMVLAPDYDGMSSWADVVAGGGRSVGLSTSDDDGHNQFLTDGDGHKFVRVLYDGTTTPEDPTDEVHNFSYPLFGGLNPNGGKAGRKLHIRWKMRWHQTDVDLTAGTGISTCIVYKNFEMYASGLTPGVTGRSQFATAGLSAGRGTNYVPYTPTSTPRAYDPAHNSFPLICYFGNSGSNTNLQCFQTNGPFLHETIVDDWADLEVQYMTMSPNSGTVDILLQTADVIFLHDQTGVLANGNYIPIPNSTGEFQISNFVASNGTYGGLSTATITRSGTTGHSLTSYTQGWAGPFLASSISGSCSALQTSESTFVVGAYVRFNRASATQSYPYVIDTFDGTTGFTASSIINDSRLFDADESGLVFSTKNDGEALFFINGTLVSACAKRYAGVVNPGDVSGTSQVWCDLIDPATMYINDAVGELAWAGNLQGNQAHHGSDYRDIQIFVDK